jgi:hypothetical protein
MLSYCGIDVSKDRLDIMVLPGQQSFAVSVVRLKYRRGRNAPPLV